MDIPIQWIKGAVIKALTEGGHSVIEDIANELSKKQLTTFIRILVKVHDQKKRDAEVIDVEVVPNPQSKE